MLLQHLYSMLNMTFKFYMVLIDACVVVGTTENMFIGSCVLCCCVVWVFCFHVCCVAWFAESMCFDSTCVFLVHAQDSCACIRVLCMHKSPVHEQESCACTRFLCMPKSLVHAQESCA